MNTAFFSEANILNLLLLAIAVIGGFIAYRTGHSKATLAMEARAMTAMQAELDAVRLRVERIEKENSRLQQIITTIQTALKKRGLIITIDGDLISIQDQGGITTHAALTNGVQPAP